MKRFTAWLLSLMMLITPLLSSAEANPLSTEEAIAILADNVVEILSGSKPGLNFTLTEPDGESLVGGFGLTNHGASVHYAHHNSSLVLNNGIAYLTDESGVISAPIQSLLGTMLGFADSFFVPTAKDLEALTSFGKELLTSLLLCDGIAYNTSNSMVSLHLNLDRILVHLNDVLPELAQKYSATLNPLLSQLSILIGQPMNLSQLIDTWRQLNLANLSTGITMDVVLFTTGDTTTLLASCMNWELKFEASEERFSFLVSDPKGKEYSFDTADVETLICLVRTLPTYMKKDWLTTEQVQTPFESRGYIQTTTISMDMDLFAKDLHQALIQLFTLHSDTIDRLISAYRPILTALERRLFYAGLISSTDFNWIRGGSSWIVRQLNKGTLSSDFDISICVVYNSNTNHFDLTGRLTEADKEYLLVDGWYLVAPSGEKSFEASLVIPDEMFTLDLSGYSYGREYSTYTLNSNRDLGGFHSISYAQEWIRGYGYVQAITTDTDILHIINNSTGLSVKAWNYTLDYKLTIGQEELRIGLPQGYFSLSRTQNSYMLNSTWGGLSITPTNTGLLIAGRYAQNVQTPITFTLTMDVENKLFNFSVIPSRGNGLHLNYRTGMLTLLADGDVLELTDCGPNTPTQNIAHLSYNGEVIASLVTVVEREEDFCFRLYSGDTTSGPCWELKLDVGAAGQAAPADAMSVPAADFLLRMNGLLQPAIEEPLAEENPDLLDAPSEAETSSELPAAQ